MVQDLPKNVDHLERWITGRLGYGDKDSPVVFLGQEESMEDIDGAPGEFGIRMYAAQGRVAAPFDDLRGCHARLARYFDDVAAAAKERGHPTLAGDAADAAARMRGISEGPPPVQPTWDRLAAFYAGFTGTQLLEAGRAQRAAALIDAVCGTNGTAASRVALVELWPMPAKRLGNWPYVNAPADAHLGSRAQYRTHWKDEREGLVRGFLRPRGGAERIILHYGGASFDLRKDLEATDCRGELGGSFADGFLRDAWASEGTLYVRTCAPAAAVQRNSYDAWHRLGGRARAWLAC